MLVLLWQGLAAASMVPQLRMTMPAAPQSAMPPCHMTGMADEPAPRPMHVVLESCCDHVGCSTAALCAVCMPPMPLDVSLPSPLRAGPLPQPLVADSTAAAGHPFRPPIL